MRLGTFILGLLVCFAATNAAPLEQDADMAALSDVLDQLNSATSDADAASDDAAENYETSDADLEYDVTEDNMDDVDLAALQERNEWLSNLISKGRGLLTRVVAKGKTLATKGVSSVKNAIQKGKELAVEASEIMDAARQLKDTVAGDPLAQAAIATAKSTRIGSRIANSRRLNRFSGSFGRKFNRFDRFLKSSSKPRRRG